MDLPIRKPYENGVVFVDFDGCISISNWRESTLPINSNRKNYDDFHSLLSFDPPNQWMIDMMDAFGRDGVRVVILTGRMEANREASVKWLNKHDVIYDWMEMRKDDDLRPSEIFKAEYIGEFFFEEVRMIFDDRQKIIKHLSQIGYPTFKVKAHV